MVEKYDSDVVVVGYGPTGVIAALTLAKYGVHVTVIERDRDLYQRARAVTINDWTLRIMHDLGVGDIVDKVIEPQRALRWVTYEGNEVLRIEMPPSVLGARARGFNIYQPMMERELRAHVAGLTGQIDVRFGAEMTSLEQDDSGVTVSTTDVLTGEGETIRARYVIAADGGSSRTRRQLGIDMEGDTLEQLWIVVDCHAKRWWPDRDFLTFWTDKERPVVDVALSAGAHRWEFPLKPGESEADYQTNEDVWPLLHAIGHDKEDIEIHQFAFYRHHTRMANRWREGRVFLAGDAAHLMPPWAGSGLQSGVRDAHNLGWKLGRVLCGELPESWLDTYEEERRPNVAFYTDLSVNLGRVIKQEVTEEEVAASQESLPDAEGTREHPLVAPPSLVAGWLRGEIGDTSAVGRMIPQPVLGNSIGKMAPLDELIGDEFVLLGANADPTQLLSPAEKADWDALGARYIPVRPQNSYTYGPDDLVDLERVLLPWMESYGVKVMAVRPDKFVAATDQFGLAVPVLRKAGATA